MMIKKVELKAMIKKEKNQKVNIEKLMTMIKMKKYQMKKEINQMIQIKKKLR